MYVFKHADISPYKILNDYIVSFNDSEMCILIMLFIKHGLCMYVGIIDFKFYYFEKGSQNFFV